MSKVEQHTGYSIDKLHTDPNGERIVMEEKENHVELRRERFPLVLRHNLPGELWPPELVEQSTALIAAVEDLQKILGKMSMVGFEPSVDNFPGLESFYLENFETITNTLLFSHLRLAKLLLTLNESREDRQTQILLNLEIQTLEKEISASEKSINIFLVGAKAFAKDLKRAIKIATTGMSPSQIKERLMSTVVKLEDGTRLSLKSALEEQKAFEKTNDIYLKYASLLQATLATLRVPHKKPRQFQPIIPLEALTNLPVRDDEQVA